MENVDVKVLLEKGAYFGHKIARTNPRSLPYTHKAQNGIYVIDLFKTKAGIEKAMQLLSESGKAGKTVLIVSTKRIIKNFVSEYCSEKNIFFMTEKWVGGFFTNFEEVRKNVKRVNTHFEKQKTGELDNMIKHQRVKLEKEINKINRIYRGVLEMTKIPDVIIVIDIKKEKNALSEARKIQSQQGLEGKSSLQTIGIADTNADPTEVDLPIVINDDSSQALEYVIGLLLGAYLEGKKSFVAETPKTEEKAVVAAPVVEKEVAKKTPAKKKTVKKTTK